MPEGFGSNPTLTASQTFKLSLTMGGNEIKVDKVTANRQWRTLIEFHILTLSIYAESLL